MINTVKGFKLCRMQLVCNSFYSIFLMQCDTHIENSKTFFLSLTLGRTKAGRGRGWLPPLLLKIFRFFPKRRNLMVSY